MSSGYEHPLTGPTKEGAVEYSQTFRDAADKAYKATGRGLLRREARRSRLTEADDPVR